MSQKMYVTYDATNTKLNKFIEEEGIVVRMPSTYDCEWRAKEELEKLYPKKKGWEIELIYAEVIFE